MTKFEELEKIQDLKDNGAITEKEFEMEKQRILNGENIQNKTVDKVKTKNGIKVKKKTVKIIIAIIATVAVVALGILLTQIITTEINIKQTESKLREIDAEELKTKLIEELKNTKLNMNDLKIKTTFGTLDSIGKDKDREAYKFCISFENIDLENFIHAYITNGKDFIMLPLFKIASDKNGKFKSIEYVGYNDIDIEHYTIENAVKKVFKDNYNIEFTKKVGIFNFNGNFNKKYNERFNKGYSSTNRGTIWCVGNNNFLNVVMKELGDYNGFYTNNTVSDEEKKYATFTFGLDF